MEEPLTQKQGSSQPLFNKEKSTQMLEMRLHLPRIWPLWRLRLECVDPSEQIQWKNKDGLSNDQHGHRGVLCLTAKKGIKERKFLRSLNIHHFYRAPQISIIHLINVPWYTSPPDITSMLGDKHHLRSPIYVWYIYLDIYHLVVSSSDLQYMSDICPSIHIISVELLRSSVYIWYIYLDINHL